MGDDFNFMNAKQYFESSDRMIRYFNENYSEKNNIKLIYSTPSMYVDALAQLDEQWPTKYDDMFPYSDCVNCFWTGYFSSRANDKGYVRHLSHTMQASNKLFSLAAISQDTDESHLNEILDAEH